MIPFDFAYLRPDTVAEAIALHREFSQQGQKAVWYAGGTEIISMARMGSIRPDAVIDLKRIPECNVLSVTGGRLRIGACVSLSHIAESGLYPLLGQAANRIADHTIQCKITIGGNLAGTIPYRETSLPLLLSDTVACVAGEDGVREVPFAQAFGGQLRVNDGDFVLSFHIKEQDTQRPFAHAKHARVEKTDYPLFTLAAVRDEAGRIRCAFSGLCAAPFRALRAEEALNMPDMSPSDRAKKAASLLPQPILEDRLGSAAYRLFRAERALVEAINVLEGGA